MNLFFWLDVIANLCQLESFRMNIEEISNEQLMEELQKQDEMLNTKTNKYLKQILTNQEKIIKLLTDQNK